MTTWSISRLVSYLIVSKIYLLSRYRYWISASLALYVCASFAASSNHHSFDHDSNWIHGCYLDLFFKDQGSPLSSQAIILKTPSHEVASLD